MNDYREASGGVHFIFKCFFTPLGTSKEIEGFPFPLENTSREKWKGKSLE